MEQSTTPTSTPTSIAPSSSPSTSAASNSWNSTSNTDDIEAKVEDLLSRMTLEDKVGQMIQLSRSADVEQTAKRIKGRRLGSLLNVIGAETADALQRTSEELPQQIPLLFGIDAVHGHALWPGATVFPTQLSMSCSWNPELIRRAARVTAKEMRATGVHWTFSPLLDVARDIRWGRINETFGEDPYLIGELGAAMVRGYQIDDEGRELEGPECVLACCKHFAGYSETQGGRDATEAEISRRKLMTTFLPPFHAACKAGAATFMTAYMAVDGVPCTQNQWLLRKVLRDDWGFKGVLISDYDNVSRLVNEHFVCSSNYEAAIRTVVSGNDMMMGTSHFFENATQAVQKGDLDPKLIDEACRRILRLKFKLGLFENRFLNTKDYEPGSAVGRDEHKKLAFECAAESVVLLKNENVLPLQAQKLKKVVVIGPSADNVQDQLGDWVCGGRWATKELPPRGNVSTVLDGIRKYCPEVTHHQGCSMLGDPMDTETIAEAVQLATTADLIVLALGDPMRWNGEQRDRANLDLPGRQQELMEAISKTGKLVVLVLVLGRPNTVPWAAEHLPAILAAFNPGQGGGEAIASIIFGDTNPSGKLTISWPRHVGQLPVFYNYLPGWHAKRYIDMTPKPQWAFGHGLSFSTFAFSHLKLSSDASSSPERTDNSTPTPERRDETTLKVGDTLNVKFNIENTGSRVGTETAMVFVHDVVASVTVPVKELKGFARVELRAGEKKEVCVAIPVERLSIVTPDLERIVEAGEFRIMVGPASDMLPLTGVLHVTK